jgi:hypothetical protein
MIVTSQVMALPEFILIVPERFKHPLSGKIVWRNDKSAGVGHLEIPPQISEILIHCHY